MSVVMGIVVVVVMVIMVILVTVGQMEGTVVRALVHIMVRTLVGPGVAGLGRTSPATP